MAPNASSSDLGERKTGEHNITFAEYKHGLVDTRFLKRSSTMSLISIGLGSRDKNVFTPVLSLAFAKLCYMLRMVRLQAANSRINK